MSVPIIDLFAGPGGLGEGFSRSRAADFGIAVSIEKDGMAFETLQLRAAHRALKRSGRATAATWRNWDSILAETPWNIAFEMLRSSGGEVIEAACGDARTEAWNVELGPGSRDEIRDGIGSRLRHHLGSRRPPENAVLIGGPPCQAYSIVGRSRNRGTEGYRPENDHRHFLYMEYLQVIKDFRPAVFVMENVKGILTSRVADRRIFNIITSDLKRPDIACGTDLGLEYVLFALPYGTSQLLDPEPGDYVVQAEMYGVPQARHRVITLGVRRDVLDRASRVSRLKLSSPPAIEAVIGDLPRVRPAISHRGDGEAWTEFVGSRLMEDILRALRRARDPVKARVADRMEQAGRLIAGRGDPGTGSDRIPLVASKVPVPSAMRRWYRDRPTTLLANHESRSHMPSDLVRYLFVAAYGRETGQSPRLADFPRDLLPSHRNIDPSAPADAIFKDRFRVQVRGVHSMTVTSHIAKDGHAFIHYDETQCRSLTVREAARLQTFPDSYVFLGTRTSQYTQVGNAVPPYLAVQIADIVGDALKRARMA
jgi:DNA (cytosine-5)-methyltransferase 1